MIFGTPMRLLSLLLLATDAVASAAHRKTPDFERLLADVAQATVDKILGGARDDASNRNLQEPMPFSPTRPCDEQFGSASKQELLALVNFYVSVLFPPGSPQEAFKSVAEEQLVALVQYDVAFYKVCGKCADFTDVTSGDGPYKFRDYCAEGSYAAGETHSSMLLLPVDETGTPLSGNLRVNTHHRGTSFFLTDTISEDFPASLGPLLGAAAESTEGFAALIADTNDVLTGLLAAMAGAISIYPDHVGYGESFTVDRPYLHPDSYALGTVVSYLASKSFIASEFGGCTVLEDVVTATGFSEGGYASIVGALALKDIGVTIKSVNVGGVPLVPEIQFLRTNVVLSTGDLDPLAVQVLPILTPLTAYAYSNDFPFLANSGTNQTLGSPEWLVDGEYARDVRQWFATPQPFGPAFLGMLPPTPFDAINSAFNDIIAEAAAVNSTRPCADFVNSDTDKMCEAVVAGELTQIIAEFVDFPMVFCHSPDDRLVFIENLPDFDSLGNDFISMYAAPLAALQPSGDHVTSRISCIQDPVTLFTPSDDPDAPLARSPSVDPPATCPSEAMAPADAPVMPPAMAPVPPPAMAPVMEPTSSADSKSLISIAAVFVAAIAGAAM